MSERRPLIDHLGPFNRFRKIPSDQAGAGDLGDPANAGGFLRERTARAKKFLRTPKGLISAGAVVAVLAAGGTATGLAAAGGSNGPDTSRSPGHGQLYERDNPVVQAEVGEALRQLHLRDDERLVVNQQESFNLATFALSAAEKTFIAKDLSVAGVSVKDKLAALSKMTPEGLLTQSYSYVDVVPNSAPLITTRISLGGNVWDTANTPALQITYSELSDVAVSTYIDQTNGVVSGIVPDNTSGKEVFPLEISVTDTRQTAETALSTIVGDQSSGAYTTFQANAEGNDSTASVSVPTSEDMIATLSVTGNITESMPVKGMSPLSTYALLTRTSTEPELKRQILWMGIRNNVSPANIPSLTLPTLTEADLRDLSRLMSQGLPAMAQV